MESKKISELEDQIVAKYINEFEAKFDEASEKIFNVFREYNAAELFEPGFFEFGQWPNVKINIKDSSDTDKKLVDFFRDQAIKEYFQKVENLEKELENLKFNQE